MNNINQLRNESFLFDIIFNDVLFILGGWTAIQMIWFTESNLHFPDNTYSFRSLSNYKDHRQVLISTPLLQLRNDMSFQQLRFYCHKKKVGTVFHIMTNRNPLGEAVVNYFIDDNLTSDPSSRPQTCDSFTVLPNDNSTLSEDCTKLGWSGSSPDGMWGEKWKRGVFRIITPLERYPDYRFHSSAKARDCDDWESGEASLSPGDTWAVFVR